MVLNDKDTKANMNDITKLQIKFDEIEMLIRFSQDQIYSAMRSLDLNLNVKSMIILDTAKEINKLKEEKENILSELEAMK